MTEVGQAVVSEDEQDWGAPRAKTVQWYDPAITAAAAAGSGLSGLEFLRAIRDGKLPPAPIAALMGFRPVEVEPLIKSERALQIGAVIAKFHPLLHRME